MAATEQQVPIARAARITGGHLKPLRLVPWGGLTGPQVSYSGFRKPGRLGRHCPLGQYRGTLLSDHRLALARRAPPSRCNGAALQLARQQFARGDLSQRLRVSLRLI
jgi:hypothetical protein